MTFSRTRILRLGSLSLLAGLSYPAAVEAQYPASEPQVRPAPEVPQLRNKTASSITAARMVPLDSINPALRERVHKVLFQPTLATHAPAEEFQASPKIYHWLMDHPDRTTLAWQRMGVPCSPIADRGQGKFSWSDTQGSEVIWSTVVDTPQMRVWYAEGHVKIGALVPSIPIQFAVVVRHAIPSTEVGKIQHEVDIFCHADSRAVNLVYRLVGPTADRMAQEAAEQMLLFFSAMSTYLTQHPQQVERLLAPRAPVRATSK
jgi:hypothetical protein